MAQGEPAGAAARCRRTGRCVGLARPGGPCLRGAGKRRGAPV